MIHSPETIRSYCDGELPREQAALIEQQLESDSDLRGRIEFERSLRQRVAQVLTAQSPSVPPGLALSVRQAVAGNEPHDQDDQDDQDDQEDHRPRLAGREPGEASPHRAWWKEPSRANVFAVAASLALVVGAVLVGILGPQIDSWSNQRLNLTSEVAGAVAGEHVAATASRAMVQRATRYSPSEVIRELGAFLESKTAILDLGGAGYELIGGNNCEVPGCKTGCHLYFKRMGKRPGLATLHIVPTTGKFPVRGDRMDLPIPTDLIPENKGCQKDVLIWKHGQHAYLLVVCIDEDVAKVAWHLQMALLEGKPER